jgi:hypothetical protein
MDSAMGWGIAKARATVDGFASLLVEDLHSVRRSGHSCGCSTAISHSIKQSEISLRVEGEDWFVLEGHSSMSSARRNP